MTTLTIRGVEPSTRRRMKELAAKENIPMGALLAKMAKNYDPAAADIVRWLKTRKSALGPVHARKMHHIAKSLRKGSWAQWA